IMNRLNRTERAQIIRALAEGNSLRSTTRITGRSINTVTKLLTDLGEACAKFENPTLVDLPATRIECDEISAFVYAKARNVPEERRFSPPVVLSQEVRVISGNPDESKVSTSYVERQNLTMRMSMRRFTRLTNGFSKKVENHAAAIALHFLYINFARPHKSLANPYPRTPAMAAGLADHIWTCEEIADLLG